MATFLSILRATRIIVAVSVANPDLAHALPRVTVVTAPPGNAAHAPSAAGWRKFSQTLDKFPEKWPAMVLSASCEAEATVAAACG
jgi:hypothetical protein